ncbi:uncharacterized protein LOC112347795 [Selaginella moellendorffii]|uniref:uncharacterized protein LOC112347795 n=1 Tax=Selaginella moellendorffii TaxID=88036 RepID=UPI000D1C7627|nr:uncharacterized protein LOC112347795 [Selaginella moellendorffii]|eukprot:XP_024534990.1 uncharacterized protein LOC112347795 [Selaginella moellendorffii]
MLPLAAASSSSEFRMRAARIGGFRALECYCQGAGSSRSRQGNGKRRFGAGSSNSVKRSQSSERNERILGNQGFAGLAALLQQRVVEQPKNNARKNQESPRESKEVAVENVFAKAFKGDLPDEDGGGNEVLTAMKKKKKIDSVVSSLNAEETSKKRSSISSSSSSSSSSSIATATFSDQSTFSEAVLAALQQSALERQLQKNKRRTMTRKNRRGSEGSVKSEDPKSVIDGVMRPIVVKPEWGSKIEDLERKLDLLKQQYYKKF